MEIQTASITVAGQEVHFRQAGSASGKPVLLLHGASFSSATWEELGILRSLAEQGYLVRAIDLPGFGNSQPNTTTARETWLTELMCAWNLDTNPPVLVAPSMSGGYAFPLLTTYPTKIAGFVAVAPVGIQTHRHRLHKLSMPVLGIWGERDRTIPLDQANLLIETVPNGKLITIPDGSHAPYMSNPRLFLDHLSNFLSDCFAGQ